MTDKEKIRAEIERLIRYLGEQRDVNLEDLCDFIDSLPEEPVSEDLEEEIKRFAYTLPYTKTGSTLSAGWVHGWRLESVIQIGKHIAQWQKEQMMRGAVDVEVTDIRTYKEENEVDFTLMLEKGVIPYEIEEEVKLIIIKEAEK